jgi:hypothetical protein
MKGSKRQPEHPKERKKEFQEGRKKEERRKGGITMSIE